MLGAWQAAGLLTRRPAEVICDRHREPMARDEPRKLYRCMNPACGNTLTDEELYREGLHRPGLRRAVVSEFYNLPGGRIA
jgi:hypothetical protein